MEELKDETRQIDEQAAHKPDYTEELIRIVRSNVSPKVLGEKVLDYHENDIAETMENLNAVERKRLYRVLNTEMLADIFSYIEEAGSYLQELDMKKRVDTISQMDADKAVVLLRQLSKEDRATLIDLIDNEAKRDIALIDSFDEDQIGSKMTTNYIAIQTGISVKQAMKELVEQAAENDNISTIYVLDEERTFYGAIELKDLIRARGGSVLEDLIATSYPYVYAQESIDDCIERIKDYSEDSIPVLDNNNKLLGVITSQDIIKVVDDEMGEDYAKLAGLTAEEDLKEPVKDSIRKRLPWLVILLGLGLVVSSVVGIFENVVAQLTLVVAFQSLILDMAGNVGTQSLAVTIRVLMDENLTGRQKLELVFKEIQVGFSNGVILGLISLLFVGLYIHFAKSKTWLFSFSVSGCIGISMVVAMVISSISGTTIPIIFKKLKVDPAVASGPLITTVNDLVAVVTYYGLTWILLIQTMHLVE